MIHTLFGYGELGIIPNVWLNENYYDELIGELRKGDTQRLNFVGNFTKEKYKLILELNEETLKECYDIIRRTTVISGEWDFECKENYEWNFNKNNNVVEVPIISTKAVFVVRDNKGFAIKAFQQKLEPFSVVNIG